MLKPTFRVDLLQSHADRGSPAFCDSFEEFSPQEDRKRYIAENEIILCRSWHAQYDHVDLRKTRLQDATGGRSWTSEIDRAEARIDA